MATASGHGHPSRVSGAGDPLGQVRSGSTEPPAVALGATWWFGEPFPAGGTLLCAPGTGIRRLMHKEWPPPPHRRCGARLDFVMGLAPLSEAGRRRGSSTSSRVGNGGTRPGGDHCRAGRAGRLMSAGGSEPDLRRGGVASPGMTESTRAAAMVRAVLAMPGSEVPPDDSALARSGCLPRLTTSERCHRRHRCARRRPHRHLTGEGRPHPHGKEEQ